ncbi:MAG: tetratricopeptide repeat protein [Bdellovibrionia bacterium]
MKKHYIIFVLLSLVLNGCSSKDKAADEADQAPASLDLVDSSDFTEESKIENKPAASVSKPAPPSQPVSAASARATAPSGRGGSNLDEAIQSKSEERIFTAARDAIARNPNDVKALNAMAMYHFNKGRTDLAEHLLKRGIKASPRSFELYNNLGIVQLSTQQNREAVLSFKEALSINPNDPVASANIGAIYVRERDYAKAVIALETAYGRGNKDLKTMNNYAVALTARGDAKKAKSIFKDILKEDQNNREALLNYAITLIDHLGENEEGLDVINRLKFVGGPSESRQIINTLENKAKAGLK